MLSTFVTDLIQCMKEIHGELDFWDLLFWDLQIDIEINGDPVDLHMKLGDNGEAFFVQEENVRNNFKYLQIKWYCDEWWAQWKRDLFVLQPCLILDCLSSQVAFHFCLTNDALCQSAELKSLFFCELKLLAVGYVYYHNFWI